MVRRVAEAGVDLDDGAGDGEHPGGGVEVVHAEFGEFAPPQAGFDVEFDEHLPPRLG